MLQKGVFFSNILPSVIEKSILTLGHEANFYLKSELLLKRNITSVEITCLN